MATDVIIQDLLPADTPQTLARRVWHQARISPWFWIGATITVLLITAAFIWPEISEISPTKINIRQRFLPPVFLEGGNWTHPLGTDQLGRDIFIRCLIGLKTSLQVAVYAVVFMFFIGCAVGLWSGFKSGWTDVVLMRLTDVQLSIPAIVLAIAILGVSRPSIPNIVLVLALAGWPVYARVARSIALNERRREFVRAARVSGASDLRIVLLLIAANVIPSLAFVAILDIARMMIFEAMLSFLGLGIQPPTPSFGTMIADGRKYMLNAWWISSIPGAFLFSVLLGLNLIGTAFERARERVYGGLV
jgi:peptide/nickel transport system permease protein